MRALPGRVLIAVLFGVCFLALAAEADNGQPDVKLLVDYQSDIARVIEPTRGQVLRPNNPRELFVFVKNNETKDLDLTVEVRAGNALLNSRPVKAEARGATDTSAKLTPVVWPSIDLKATKYTEATGPVRFRLVTKDNKVLSQVALAVDRPSNYLSAKLNFDPKARGDLTNRLETTITRKPEFRGTACRTELVLPADSTVFTPGQRRRGFYADAITTNTKSVTLNADNIQLVGTGTINSWVYITADGYERAFVFRTTFSRDGTPFNADPIQVSSAYFDVPAYANPSKPVPVRVEVDNLPAGNKDSARLLVELVKQKKPAKNDADKNEVESGSALATFVGERQQRILFMPGGAQGGILFQAEVKSWEPQIDMSSLYGNATLRLRVLDGEGEKAKVVSFLDRNANRQTATSIERDIILDETPPEVGKLVNIPVEAVRGRKLSLAAEGEDPESKIKDVVFFVGKPLPDGKAPSDPASIKGQPVLEKDKDKGKDKTQPTAQPKKWTAELLVPSDAPGQFTVSVLFTNNVGLTKSDTVQIPVVDPEKATQTDGKNGKDKDKKKSKASIAGQVVEGERPQKGLNVQLFNDSGKLIQSAKSDEDGKFIFKDLDPGSYKIVATKSASRTRGEQTVAVTEGEQKKDVEIKLYR